MLPVSRKRLCPGRNDWQNCLENVHRPRRTQANAQEQTWRAVLGPVRSGSVVIANRGPEEARGLRKDRGQLLGPTDRHLGFLPGVRSRNWKAGVVAPANGGRCLQRRLRRSRRGAEQLSGSEGPGL